MTRHDLYEELGGVATIPDPEKLGTLLPALYSFDGMGMDAPVGMKIFNPCGAESWYLTEYDAETDTAFGWCDLGWGCPELGYVSMAEMRAIKGPLGIGLEVDLYFGPKTLKEVAA